MSNYSFPNIDAIIQHIFALLLSQEQDIVNQNLNSSQLTNQKWLKYYKTQFDNAFPYMNLDVAGPVRNQTEPTKTAMKIKIDIEIGGYEPMNLVSNKLINSKTKDNIPLLKKSNYWNVDIRLPPQSSPDGSKGHCFYMSLMIPRALLQSESAPTASSKKRKRGGATELDDGVLLAWLYQIMINPLDHSQIMPAACLGPDVPNYQWGTLFMQLFDTVCSSLSRGVRITEVHDDGVAQTRVLLTKVLAGLVDDAFLEYCGHHINFSDMRRFQGLSPWYETYNFRMANLTEYVSALQLDTYSLAKTSVFEKYAMYVAALNDCGESMMPNEERAQFCSQDKACQSLQTRKEIARYVAEAIRKNDEEHGCFWVSNQAPKTCLTQFNRKYNPQTWHLPEEDVVLRLKFYSD